VAPPRKSHAGLIVGIIFLLVVIAGGGAGGWYYWKNLSKVAPEQTTAEVVAGQSIELSALATGKDKGVSWDVVEATAGGAVAPTTSEKTAAGTRYKASYTAPLTAGTYHVRVYPGSDSNKGQLIEVHVTAPPTPPPGSTNLSELFISQADFDSNWEVISKDNGLALNLAGGMLAIATDPRCAVDDHPTVLFRSKQTFAGDFAATAAIRHSGSGQSHFQLRSSQSNKDVAAITLDTFSNAGRHLILEADTNSTGNQISGANYADKWITYRIQLQQGQVSFFADGELLKTFPLPAGVAPDESYHLVFGATRECDTKSAGETSVNLIRASK